MQVHNLSSAPKNIIEIKIQSTTDLDSLEYLLKYCYSKSLDKKNKQVIFNFKYVTWIEPFALSILTIWMLELKSSGKAVTVLSPSNTRVVRFLKSYGFQVFAEKNSIPIDKNFPEQLHKSQEISALYPLTFSDNKAFQEYLKNLTLDNFYNIIFDEIRHSEVARGGIIRDIVLKELGDNMYTHADGRFSNFLISRTNLEELKYERRYSPFEEAFFKSLKTRVYVEIIISDKGPGLIAKLSPTYRKEKKIDKKISLDQCDVIEYSTLEHSTSRTNEERLEELYGKLSKDIENISPFTGLFHIRETVKRYNGLLLIRSGRSIVSFFSDLKYSYTRKSSSIRKYQHLANFGGTQIRIILPIYNEAIFELNEHFVFNLKEIEAPINFHNINLCDYFELSNKKKIDKKTTDSYHSIISEIKSKSENSGYNGIIIDFFERNAVDTKVIFLLICQIMVFQRNYPNTIYALLNIDKSLLPILNEVLKNKKDFIKTPIVVFTKELQRDILGLSDLDKKIFSEIIQLREITQDNHKEFCEKFPHIFAVSNDQSRFEFRHNKLQILTSTLHHIEKRISKIIYEKRNNLYIDNIQCLTPSAKYTTEYFQLHDMFSLKKWNIYLLEYLKLFTALNKPEFILSIGEYCGKLIDNFLNQNELRKKRIEHYTITSLNYQSHIGYIATKSSTKKILLFTDVIGSGKSLFSITKEFPNSKEEISVLTIVNLTGKNEMISDKTHICISCCIQKEGILYNNHPAGWLYEDLMTVDKTSFKLIKSDLSLKNTSDFHHSEFLSTYSITFGEKDSEGFTPVINGFLQEVVMPSNAFYQKVVSRNTYFPIMFNISLIFELIGDKVLSDLLNTLFEFELSTKSTISTLLHLEYQNDPFRPLKTALLKNYPAIELFPLDFSHINVPNIQENIFTNKSVLILDDVMSTGETLGKLIDYCESRNAKYIFCYILIRCSDDFTLKRFTKLKKYGRSLVFFKYLFDVQLPLYRGENIPFITTQNNIRNIEGLFKDTPLISFIKNLLEKLRYTDSTDISLFKTPGDDNQVILWRWKLELAKSKPQFRKELSILFNSAEENISQIYIVFSILEHEQHLFLKDAGIKKNIFFEKLKAKIISVCKQILQTQSLTTDIYNVYTTSTVFIYLSCTEFINFVLYELKKEVLKSENFFFPCLTLLTLLEDYESVKKDRFLILDKIKETLPQNTYNSMVHKLSILWKSENEEIYKELSSQKIHVIKSILKSNFHDLGQLVTHIKENISSLSDEILLQYWERIKTICRMAIDKYSLLFSSGFYPEIKMRIYPFLREMNNRLVISNTLMQKSLTSNSDIINTLEHLRDLIFGKNSSNIKDSLLKITEINFRVDIKAAIRHFIDNDLKGREYKIAHEITESPCNAFCNEVDFSTILINIFSNVERHSNATSIYFKLYVKNTQVENLIILEVWNNGVENDNFITLGVGLQNCISKSQMYSGSFEFKNEKAVYNEIIYDVCAKIIFHNLSKEVINEYQQN